MFVYIICAMLAFVGAAEPSVPTLSQKTAFLQGGVQANGESSSQSIQQAGAADRIPEASQGSLPESQNLSERGLVWIRLRNGREVVGRLDLRTSGQELWVRSGSETLNIIRPIPWDEVAQIRVDAQPVPVGFLREFFDLLWASVRSEANVGSPTPAHPPMNFSPQQWQLLPASLREFGEAIQNISKRTQQPTRRILLEGKEDQPSELNACSGTKRTPADHGGFISTGTDGSAQATSAGTRVAYFSLDVWLGQWDGDVEPDGLIVEIVPLDTHGQPVPVQGMLEVTLVIPPRALTAAVDQKSHRQRWVQRVRPEDFSPGTGSARYRFEFGPAQNNPEWNLDLANYGAVSAQLSVPGQGVFSATAGCVRVRPFSPVRDRLQESTGKRFFPWERSRP